MHPAGNGVKRKGAGRFPGWPRPGRHWAAQGSGGWGFDILVRWTNQLLVHSAQLDVLVANAKPGAKVMVDEVMKSMDPAVLKGLMESFGAKAPAPPPAERGGSAP